MCTWFSQHGSDLFIAIVGSLLGGGLAGILAGIIAGKILIRWQQDQQRLEDDYKTLQKIWHKLHELRRIFSMLEAKGKPRLWQVVPGELAKEVKSLTKELRHEKHVTLAQEIRAAVSGTPDTQQITRVLDKIATIPEIVVGPRE